MSLRHVCDNCNTNLPADGQGVAARFVEGKIPLPGPYPRMIVNSSMDVFPGGPVYQQLTFCGWACVQEWAWKKKIAARSEKVEH